MSILKLVGVGLFGAGCVVSALMYRESSSGSCCPFSGGSMVSSPPARTAIQGLLVALGVHPTMQIALRNALPASALHGRVKYPTVLLKRTSAMYQLPCLMAVRHQPNR